MRPARSRAQEQGDSMASISDTCRFCGKHVRRTDPQVVSGNSTAHWDCSVRREAEIADMEPK